MPVSVINDQTSRRFQVNLVQASGYSVEEYHYNKSQNDLNESLSVDIVCQPGHVLYNISKGDEIDVTLGYIVKKMTVTDINRDAANRTININAESNIYKLTKRTPARPIRYMSLTYEEWLDFSSQLDSVEFFPKVVIDKGKESSRRGWRLSEVLKDLGKTLELTVVFSGADHWVKQVNVESSIYSAITELTKKYSLRTIKQGNKLILVDDCGTHAYGGGGTLPSIRTADSVNEEESDISIPDEIIVKGSDQIFDPDTYKGYRVADTDFYKEHIFFGNIGNFVSPASSGTSQGYDQPPVTLLNWARGYDAYPNSTTIQVTTNKIQEDVTQFTSEQFGFELPLEVASTYGENQQKIDGRRKRIIQKSHLQDFFGNLGPVCHKTSVEYIDTILGYQSDVNTAQVDENQVFVGQIEPILIVSYEEEATHYGNSMNAIYGEPRIRNGISKETLFEYIGSRDGDFVNRILTGTSTFTKNQPAFKGLPNHQFEPYFIKVKFSRMLIPSSPQATDIDFGGSENTKILLPSEVVVKYAIFAEYNEGLYKKGDTKFESTLTFSPVARDDNGFTYKLSEVPDSNTGITGIIPQNWTVTRTRVTKAIDDSSKTAPLPTTALQNIQGLKVYGANNDQAFQIVTGSPTDPGEVQVDVENQTLTFHDKVDDTHVDIWYIEDQNLTEAADWTHLISRDCLVENTITWYEPMRDGKSHQEHTVSKVLKNGTMKPEQSVEYKTSAPPNKPLKYRKEPLEYTENIGGSAYANANTYNNTKCYDSEPLYIEDSSIFVESDARQIARRTKQRLKNPSKLRTYSFSFPLYVDIGTRMIMGDVYCAPPPFDESTEYFGNPTYPVLIAGSPTQIGVVTDITIGKQADNAITTITVESIS